MGQACLALRETFMLAGVGGHCLQDEPVVLQPVPVQAFEPVAVEDAPHAALPTLHLAAAPEEDAAMPFVDRGHEAADDERSAGPGVLPVPDRQAHPLRTGVAPFRPVESDPALAFFLAHQAKLALADAHH